MAKYKTTVTKKDGTKVSGYIENDRGYYDDGSAIGAGDSIVDKQGTVWTKPDTASTGAGGTGSGTGAGAGTGSGTGTPSTVDLINEAIRKNNSGGGGSSSSSYRVSGVDKPNRTGYLRSARELADLYDINYDMDAIRNLYDDATNAKYELLSKEREQAENDFYTNNANANATLLDTLKKATSSAIATGASRGLAGAEQLGLMMEQQQAITDEATNLAQERANMADEIAAEKAENIIKALEYSDSIKQALAGVSSNVYSADTQYDVGLLDWAAQMKNVEALFEQIATEKDVNLKAQELEGLKALLDKETADADRASNERIKAAEAEAQQAYYDYMMKNATGSSGGSGYGKTLDEMTPEELEAAYTKAYSEGNQHVAAMYAYKMGMWDSVTDAFNTLTKDKTFQNNKKNILLSKAPAEANGYKTNVKTSQDMLYNATILNNIYNKYGENSSEYKSAYQKLADLDNKSLRMYVNHFRVKK